MSRVDLPVYLTALFLSTIWSTTPMIAWYGLPAYHEGALVLFSYVIIMVSAGDLKFSHTREAILISVLLVGFFGVLQAVYGNFLMIGWIRPLIGSGEFWALPRPLYSTLANSNHLGLFCALTFPFVLAEAKSWRWVFPLILLVFLTIGCESRGAWISVAMTTGIILWKRKSQSLFVTLLIISLLGTFHFRHEVRERLHYRDVRLHIWKQTMPLLKNCIVLGKGPANFIRDYPQKSFPIIDRPHNMYLQVWHASGLISLLAMGGIVFRFFRRCKVLSLNSAVLGFLIAGLFTDSMVGVTPIFFVLLGYNPIITRRK